MKHLESRRLASLLGIPVHQSWLLRKLRLDGVDTPETLIALAALRERCGEVFLHVVNAAQRVDFQNPRWSQLSELITERFRRLKPVTPGILPSDGRFCVETGFIGRKKAKQVHLTWLRPIRTES